MQVRIEQLTDDIGEKHIFVRVKNNKRVKPHLEVIGASFINDGVVTDSLINDLTGVNENFRISKFF